MNRIELGWILAGRLDPLDREAAELARTRLLSGMREDFSELDWQMPRTIRPEAARGARVEPVDLLEIGIAERHARHWDFSIVVTGADLVSHYGPQALATASRSVDVAILSTSRIDPLAAGEEFSTEERKRVLAQRIFALAMHLLGRLNGVEHHDSRGDVMSEIDSVGVLDGMERYSERARDELRRSLRDVADLRLEEAPQRRSRPLFYLQAGWLNLREIATAVRQARPWLFPLRLGRLSAAAISVLFVLMVTAEVWELGMSQPAARVGALTAAVFVATTVYIIKRQRLLVRPGSRSLTEQMVVTNVATTLCVLLGLVTTYLFLLLAVFVLALAIYPASLVESWASSLAEPIHGSHYGRLAAFVASLGILIGALGASFEGYQYFRHVIFVDEEV
ncbi:MAG TPA: hypothetical protein VEK15_17645 [Vicinamibacteria bacterium]|nr:hypothetical protein [Vicinamibacteria bacterium]